MPVYKLQGPDGKVYTIEGPAGASAEQLAAVITGQSASKQERAKAAQDAARKEFDPTNGMSTTDKVLAGMGKAFTDVGRGAGQLVGVVDRNDVAESRKTDEALMNTGAGQVGNVLGNVAAFAPTAMIPGANTVTGGALIGAASGLLAPSASTGETAKNVALGGGAGAAVPALIAALKTGKSFIEPLYQAGRDKIVGRAIADTAAQDPAALAQALRSNPSTVPGVQRTVAEVADNPSLAALQRTASQINPSVMNDAAARAAANNEARITALRGIAGDKSVAVQAREAATSALYDAANGKAITLTPELESLLSRPQMKSAVGSAQTLAANEGRPFSLSAGTPPAPSPILGPNGQPLSVTPGRAGSLMGEDAHTIKRALDDTIEALAGQGGLGKNARRAAAGTKEEFLGQVEKQVPEYGQARQTFAKLSEPVNQAEVADAIVERALKSNVQGNLTPAAYNRALSDRTAQSALGRTNATLEGTFSPQQMGVLNSVKEDLKHLDFANTAGKGGGSDTVQKLAYSNMLNQAGVPSAVRNFAGGGIVGNVAQRAGQIVYKDANEKLGEQLARALMNPNDAADLVTGAMVSPQMQALANALKRAGTGAGASVPALVQANQQ